MAQLAEVALAQAKQRRTVKLGVAADVVVRVRMKILAVLVAPRFVGVVVSVNIDYLGIPIGFLAGNVVAALQNKDALAGGREMVRASVPPPAPVPMMITS